MLVKPIRAGIGDFVSGPESILDLPRTLEVLESQGVPSSRAHVMEEIRIRDQRDSSRSAAPLRQAEDALYLLTDGLNANEVAENLLSRVRVLPA